MQKTITVSARVRSFFERERYAIFLPRWLFLRLLGLIYFIAFVSLWTQIDGLIGRRGILPAGEFMQAAREQLGGERYWWLPTFCWLNAGDGFLHLQCAAGAGLSLLLVAGMAPIVDLILLWALYLSLSTVCRDFLSFQWDILLLETGFLAIFLAPRQWLPRLARETAPSGIVLWLCRWLLFRLMFMSGAVKLLSGDAAWRNLTALAVHYETQPLPTWIGWYAHQLPLWFQKISLVLMFLIELAGPFLIFCGRSARQVASGAFVFLMLLISSTGNYCFFNLLTVALCVLLFDDAFFLRCLPAPIAARLRTRLAARNGPRAGRLAAGRSGKLSPSQWTSPPGTGAHPIPLEETNQPAETPEGVTSGKRSGASFWAAVRAAGVGALAALILLVSGLETTARIFRVKNLPGAALQLLRLVSPFRTINSYGLFAVMTTTRPEIVLEGSNDGIQWLAYEFKWKPGALNRPPSFAAPHQPRLDWQMWFAALGTYRDHAWFGDLLARLLQGSPQVLALLEKNPFPDHPPRYLRATLYEYHFTDVATRRATGNWWRREAKGLYCPQISLRQN